MVSYYEIHSDIYSSKRNNICIGTVDHNILDNQNNTEQILYSLHHFVILFHRSDTWFTGLKSLQLHRIIPTAMLVQNSRNCNQTRLMKLVTRSKLKIICESCCVCDRHLILSSCITQLL